MTKAIILYVSKECALCNEVELMAEDVSEKTKVPLYKINVDEIPDKTETPMTCVATIRNDKVQIKNDHCFVGWDDYRNRLLELLARV